MESPLFNVVFALLIFSFVPSLFWSVVFHGRPNPWLVAGGTLGLLRRGINHLFRSAAKGLRGARKDCWRQSKQPGTTVVGRMLLWMLAVVLALVATLLSIPPAILGGGGKK